MHGQKDDLDIFLFLHDLPDSVDAIKERHGDICNDDIGAQLLCRCYQSTTVCDDIDRTEFGFE